MHFAAYITGKSHGFSLVTSVLRCRQFSGTCLDPIDLISYHLLKSVLELGVNAMLIDEATGDVSGVRIYIGLNLFLAATNIYADLERVVITRILAIPERVLRRHSLAALIDWRLNGTLLS